MVSNKVLDLRTSPTDQNTKDFFSGEIFSPARGFDFFTTFLLLFSSLLPYLPNSAAGQKIGFKNPGLAAESKMSDQ